MPMDSHELRAVGKPARRARYGPPPAISVLGRAIIEATDTRIRLVILNFSRPFRVDDRLT
jgi:hypothetical protein